MTNLRNARYNCQTGGRWMIVFSIVRTYCLGHALGNQIIIDRKCQYVPYRSIYGST